MKRLMMLVASIALSGLSGCDSSAPAADTAGANDQTSALVAGAPMVDAELEQLKNTIPVDACSWLPPEKLESVFPGLKFEVKQKLEPRMSGYVWDSRCSYQAGVGTIEYAKDTPTHTVDFFVNTAVSEAKAQSNLASRRESAVGTTGFQEQPDVGVNAYSSITTGMGRLHFVKGQTELQIQVSDLETSNEQKIANCMSIAGLL